MRTSGLVETLSTFALAAVMAAAQTAPPRGQSNVPAASPGYIVDAAYSKLDEACSAAASARKTLLLTRAWDAVPAQFPCSIMATTGGIIKPGANQSVTVHVFDGDLTQHFDLSSKGAVVTGFVSREVYSQWWGGAYDGKTVDDAPINAALAAGANGPVVRIAGKSAIRHIVLPTTANVRLTVRADPGAIWYCQNTGDSDCVAAVSTAYSNPIYDLELPVMLGPDKLSGVSSRPCATATSGNGLRISGAATARIFLQRAYMQQFCGAGKSAVLLGNIEDGSIRDSDLSLNARNLSFTTLGGFAVIAMTVENVLLSQASEYNFYGMGGGNTTFVNTVFQSSAKYGFYWDAAVAVTHIDSHFENNDISNTVPDNCSETFDAATGNAGNSQIIGGSLNGPRDKFCFLDTGAGKYSNLLNTVIGTIANSSQGFFVGPNSTRHSFVGLRGNVAGGDKSTAVLDAPGASGGKTSPPPATGCLNHLNVVDGLVTGAC